MTVVIDTPEGIQFFALLQAKYRLKLEIDTGVRFKQSTLKAVNKFAYQQFPDVGPNYFTRKQQAYDWLCLVVDEIKEQREAGQT